MTYPEPDSERKFSLALARLLEGDNGLASIYGRPASEGSSYVLIINDRSAPATVGWMNSTGGLAGFRPLSDLEAFALWETHLRACAAHDGWAVLFSKTGYPKHWCRVYSRFSGGDVIGEGYAFSALEALAIAMLQAHAKTHPITDGG